LKRDIKLFVKDIISAMDAIEEFVGGTTINELEKDDKTASAVIRKFEIIGEAKKQIPSALRSKHSEITWSRMSGMRDRLIHAYFGIDYKLVWDAIKTDIPNLKLKLEKMLVNL
jgi:uncharacterized protein with HEPN domain